MNFSEILAALKQGHLVQRSGWNGKNMHVSLVLTSSELNAHFRLRNAQGSTDTWVPSVSDLLAEDWEIIVPFRHDEDKEESNV